MIDFLATTALPIAALLGYGAGAVLASLKFGFNPPVPV